MAKVLLIGIGNNGCITNLRDALKIDVVPLKENAKDCIVEDIVKNTSDFAGSETWHSRKFVIMHGLDNSKIKEVLSLCKSLGLRDAIFATTTETSLKWKLKDLLDELVKEDEYFRKVKRHSR